MDIDRYIRYIDGCSNLATSIFGGGKENKKDNNIEEIYMDNF